MCAAQGLFLGVELVRDRTTLEPAPDEATDLINRMAARGILLATDGPFHNVLKIKPPMVLTADDVDMPWSGRWTMSSWGLLLRIRGKTSGFFFGRAKSEKEPPRS